MASNKKLTRAGQIATKICEVFHWIVAIEGILGAALYFFAPIIIAPMTPGDRIGLLGLVAQGYFSYGLHTCFTTLNPSTAGVIFLFVGINAAIMAFVFHKVSWCLKSDQDETPFKPDVQHVIRLIGFLMIGIFALDFVGQFVVTATANATGCDISTSVTFEMAIIGLLMLCLSRVFDRGIELESEVEGLI